MTRKQPLDGRLERLLDEEMRSVVQAPRVDLRAKVLQAIDEGRGTREAGRADRESRFGRILQPRWAFAFAAAAVLLLAVLIPWRGSVQPPRETVSASRAPLASRPIAASALVEPPAVSRSSILVALAAARGPRRPLTWGTRPPVLADASASDGPYLPGAPAGDLGDPLRPLPSPPPITFAPIAAAPPVSNFARPVTDFPANDAPPAADSGGAGPSGGTRR